MIVNYDSTLHISRKLLKQLNIGKYFSGPFLSPGESEWKNQTRTFSKIALKETRLNRKRFVYVGDSVGCDVLLERPPFRKLLPDFDSRGQHEDFHRQKSSDRRSSCKKARPLQHLNELVQMCGQLDFIISSHPEHDIHLFTTHLCCTYCLRMWWGSGATKESRFRWGGLSVWKRFTWDLRRFMAGRAENNVPEYRNESS